MFCPQCGVEYPWHVMVCPACDAETVDRLPAPAPTPDAELAPIFATGDPALIAVVKSLLDAEDIDYFAIVDAEHQVYMLPIALVEGQQSVSLRKYEDYRIPC